MAPSKSPQVVVTTGTFSGNAGAIGSSSSSITPSSPSACTPSASASCPWRPKACRQKGGERGVTRGFDFDVERGEEGVGWSARNNNHLSSRRSAKQHNSQQATTSTAQRTAPWTVDRARLFRFRRTRRARDSADDQYTVAGSAPVHSAKSDESLLPTLATHFRMTVTHKHQPGGRGGGQKQPTRGGSKANQAHHTCRDDRDHRRLGQTNRLHGERRSAE